METSVYENTFRQKRKSIRFVRFCRKRVMYKSGNKFLKRKMPCSCDEHVGFIFHTVTEYFFPYYNMREKSTKMRKNFQLNIEVGRLWTDIEIE